VITATAIISGSERQKGVSSNLIFENVIFARPVCVLMQFNSWFCQPAIVFARNNHLHLKELEILRKMMYYPQYSTTVLHTCLLRRYVCYVKGGKTYLKCALLSLCCLKPLPWAINEAAVTMTWQWQTKGRDYT
jgi:hypothetical protein